MSPGLENMSEDGIASVAGKEKKSGEVGKGIKSLCQFVACISVPVLITSLFAVITHLFIAVPFAFVAQDLSSPSKQITAAAHANS